MATTDDDFDPRDDVPSVYPTGRKGSYLLDFDGGGKYLMRPAAGGAGEFATGSVRELVDLLSEGVPGLSVTDDDDESPEVFGGGIATWAEVFAVLSAPDSPRRDVVSAIRRRVSWASDYLYADYDDGKQFWILTQKALAADAAHAVENPGAKGGS